MGAYRHAILVAALLCLAWSVPATAADPVELQLSPEAVEIGSFYDGGTVHVAGTVPAGADVVLRIVGHTGELRLKHKGKALGLLWMNLDTMTFTNVPSVFLVVSSAPLDQMAGLGLAGLASGIGVESDGGNTDGAVDELLKLKRSEKLYAERSMAMAFTDTAEGRLFEADLALPSRLSPGEYRVEAFAVAGGKVLASESRPMEARLVSFPAFLSAMAFNHGAMYGVMATVLAILGGLIISRLFQGGGGAH